MNPKTIKLIEDVLSDIDSKSLSQLLPKAQQIAKYTNNEAFNKWVQLETSGYFNTNSAFDEKVIVPDYRKVPGRLIAKDGRPIQFEDPEFNMVANQYPVREGVSEIEKMVEHKGMFSIENGVMGAMYQKQFGIHIDRFDFNPSSLNTVLSEIRIKLNTFLLEIDIDSLDIQANTEVVNMDVFISHSHQDVDIAKALIELLKISLNLSSDKIRCTSVDGYRLPAGISTDQQLKSEIHDSKILIGLISPSSISSYYVLFELGARWGANKPLIPLIANAQGAELLKGPLQGINALSAIEEAQLFQLIEEIGTKLGIKTENPASYQHYIKKLTAICSGTVLKTNDIQPTELDYLSNYDGAEEQIKSHCKMEWPEDFHMQVNCINEQKAALEILKKGKPADINDNDFTLIRKKVAEEWPDDFHMRVSQEREQYEAIRKLRSI